MRLNLSTVFENHLKCLIFHQFLSYKIDLSGNTVNLARFARNIELLNATIFGNFQTLCLSVILLRRSDLFFRLQVIFK